MESKLFFFVAHMLMKNNVITFSCEDHRLRIANDDPMEQRSQKAKDEYIQRKDVLADQVCLSNKDEMSYDNMTSQADSSGPGRSDLK